MEQQFNFRKVQANKAYAVVGTQNDETITLDVSLLHTTRSWCIKYTLNKLVVANKFLLFDTIEEAFEFFKEIISSDKYQIEESDENQLRISFEGEIFRKKRQIQLRLDALDLTMEDTLKKHSRLIAAMYTEIESLTARVNSLPSVERLDEELRQLKHQIDALRRQHQQKYESIDNLKLQLQKLERSEAFINNLRIDNNFTKQEYVVNQYQFRNDIIDSLIAKPEDIGLLKSWIYFLGPKVKTCQLVLIYRGSRDGFSAAAFHQKVDGKAQTLHLIETSDSVDRFGGFTSLAWMTEEKNQANDNTAFVFSLTHKKRYSCNDRRYVFFTGKDQLSNFGGGQDIQICSDANKNANSYSIMAHSYGKNEGANQRSLTANHNFQIKEIEVFQVIVP